MFWNKKKKRQEDSEHWTKKSENADPKYTKIETGSVIMIDHTKKPDEDGFLHVLSRSYINVSDLSAEGSLEVSAHDAICVHAEAITQQIEQMTNALIGSFNYENAPQEDIDAIKYNIAYLAFKQTTQDTGINLEFLEFFEDD